MLSFLIQHLSFRRELLPITYHLLALGVVCFVAGCSRSALDPQVTQKLFESVQSKQLGSKFDIALSADGISIHPGPQPTSVTFSGRELGRLTVTGMIAPLPNEASNDREAGIVGVTFIVDGKAGPRRLVDRDKAIEEVIDFGRVDLVTVTVDQGNNTADYDWFHLQARK